MVESRINRQASARPNRGVVRRFRVVGLPPRRQWPRQAPARRFCGAMSAAMGSLLPTHAHVLPSCRRRPLYCKSPLAAQPVPAPPIQPTSLPGLHRATQRVCRYTRAYQGLAGTHEGLTKGLLAHTKGLPRACPIPMAIHSKGIAQRRRASVYFIGSSLRRRPRLRGGWRTMPHEDFNKSLRPPSSRPPRSRPRHAPRRAHPRCLYFKASHAAAPSKKLRCAPSPANC